MIDFKLLIPPYDSHAVLTCGRGDDLRRPRLVFDIVQPLHRINQVSLLLMQRDNFCRRQIAVQQLPLICDHSFAHPEAISVLLGNMVIGDRLAFEIIHDWLFMALHLDDQQTTFSRVRRPARCQKGFRR